MKNFTISLFAFHLRHNLQHSYQEHDKQADRLWSNLATLGDQGLPFPNLKNIKSSLHSYQDGVYTPKRDLERSWHLTNQRCLDLGEINSDEGFQIQGNLQAFRINDTYAVDLTLSAPPETDILPPSLSCFQPQSLLPNKINASLGQTIILYGKITETDQEKCQEMATKYATALLANTNYTLNFDQKNFCQKVFGCLLFEYEGIDRNNPENLSKNCQILIYLDKPDSSLFLTSFGQSYDTMLHLMCSYHKIRHVYSASRTRYQDGKKYSSDLSKIGNFLAGLNQISTNQLTDLEKLEKNIKDLQDKLAQIWLLSFNYEVCLTDLQSDLTTIEVNTKNYERCCQNLPLEQTDGIELWQNFIHISEETYQQQIKVDLNYLKPDQLLCNQLTATIQPIVDLQKAEIDRLQLIETQKSNELERQQLEETKKREKEQLEESKKLEKEQLEESKKLENTIKTATIALTVGTSTASATSISSGRIDKFINQSNNNPVLGVSVALIIVVTSISLGSLLGFLAWKIANVQLNKSLKPKTNTTK